MRHPIRSSLLALAILTAPMVSGCSVLGGGSVTVPANVKQAATKAMIDAEICYQGVAITINQGKASGLISGDKVPVADKIKSDAWRALLVARQAYSLGTIPSTAALASFLLQAQALTK